MQVAARDSDSVAAGADGELCLSRQPWQRMGRYSGAVCPKWTGIHGWQLEQGQLKYPPMSGHFAEGLANR